MSEITRKRFEKKVTLKHGTLTIKGRPWTTPRELGKEADFERQVEEARRKEQQVKEELRMTREEVIRELRTKIDKQISDEKRSHELYLNLVRHAETLELQRFVPDLRRMAGEEYRHLQELLSMFKDLQKR